ncbi:MAG: hypothetical protein E7077_03815 [Bacteroidales bacterium]|nr:hypothetical protein [Bacteroidales bacterium]
MLFHALQNTGYAFSASADYISSIPAYGSELTLPYSINHQPFPKGTHNLRLSTNRLYFAEQNTVGFYVSSQPKGIATTINPFCLSPDSRTTSHATIG